MRFRISIPRKEDSSGIEMREGPCAPRFYIRKRRKHSKQTHPFCNYICAAQTKEEREQRQVLTSKPFPSVLSSPTPSHQHRPFSSRGHGVNGRTARVCIT